VIAAGRTRTVDLLHVAFRDHDDAPVERYVVNMLSAGPGGLVDRYVERLPALVGGRLSYGLAAAWALVRTPRARLRLRLWDDPAGEAVVERELDTWLLGVCNGPVFGGGMRLAPGARVDDGMIDVVSIGPARKLTVARHLPAVYRGRHVLVPGVEVLRCRGLEVELGAPADPERFALDVDGDALGRLPLRARLVPGALTVLAPPDARAPR
jgi:diacylglycerol kinase family enzyme